MKNQDILPTQQIKEFLLPLAENVYKNFIAGVDSIGKILWKQEEQKGFEEGGVFVQEDRTAKRGSQEA